MKKSTTRFFWMASLVSLCMLSLPVTLRADSLESGSVYRIVNAAYNRAVTEEYLSKKITTTSSVGTTSTDWEQLWIVTHTSGNRYSLQNVFSGNYMSSSISTSQQMSTTTSANTLTLSTASYDAKGWTITGSMPAHCASSQSYWLVGWNTPDAAANTFYFTSVEGVDIAAARAAYDAFMGQVNNASTYDTALQTFFEDRACTILKAEYASLSDDELTALLDDAGLPAILRQMALKVKNDSWGECEKMFRVQDYEICASASEWTSWTRQNAQTNMKNPTGIIAANRDILYVMVDNDIPSGASLYLTPCGLGYLSSPTTGTRLQKGLNMVPVTSDGNWFCLMYSANTYNGGNYLPVADFPDMKIHIEGGSVDGYYEMGAGTEIFNWLVKNHKHDMIQLKGRYILLDIYTEDLKKHAKAATIDGGIDAWDYIVKWQLSLMGLLWDCDDAVTSEYIGSEGINTIIYPDYYNSYHLAWSDPNGYMDATWWRTHYARSTWSGLLSKQTLFYSGPCCSWGPAHEIGHTNQGSFNMPGGTEVTNNLFSNMVNFMVGYGDSRGTTNLDVTNYYANHTPWYMQDIWTQTRMYYHLFLYYHAAKNDITFYPRLLEALRKDGLVWGSANSTGNPCLGQNMHLKFYEKCCHTAGEDLTDFFRAYGFFEPMNLLLVGDYSNYYVTSTQANIDASIRRVKTRKYPENRSVIFIDDRSQDVPVSGLYKAEGGTGLKKDHGEHPTASLGYNTGSYIEYEGEGTVPGGYTLTQNGSKMTFANGTGAVGFMVYAADGKLLAFTNANTLSLPSDYDGGAVTILAIGSKQATQEITGFDPDQASTNTLKTTLAAAKSIIKLEDIDGTHPGFFTTASLEALKALVTQTEQAMEEQDVAQYGRLNEQLQTEMTRLEGDVNARTPIVAGAYYRLRNYAYPSRYMSYASNRVATKVSSSNTDVTTWWRMYETGSSNTYRIASQNGKFINTISTSTQATCNSTNEADGLQFVFSVKSNGTFAIITTKGGTTGLHSAANDSYKVVGWSDTPATNWYMEEVQSAEVTSLRDVISRLSTKATGLMGQADDCDEKTRMQRAVDYAKEVNKVGAEADILTEALAALRNAYTALWQLLYPGTVDFDACDETQFFRLMNVDSKLWLDLSAGKVRIQTKSETSRYQCIHFVPSTYAGQYYICSENGYYMALGTTNTWDMVSTKTVIDNTRYRFKVNDLGEGKYSLTCMFHPDKFIGLDALTAGSALYPDKNNTYHVAWLFEPILNPDGILPLETDADDSAKEGIRSLSGQQVQSVEGLQPGIYIINGRKRLVK